MQAKNVSDNDGGDDDNSNEYMKTSCRCVLQDTRLRILRLPGTGKMRRSEPAAFCEECYENGEKNYRKILQENWQDDTFRACSSIL